MSRMNTELRREVEKYFVADTLIVCAYQNTGALTNRECLVVRNYAREVRKEIISCCEKHFRYGG
jgi:hypothetical protein